MTQDRKAITLSPESLYATDIDTRSVFHAAASGDLDTTRYQGWVIADRDQGTDIDHRGRRTCIEG